MAKIYRVFTLADDPNFNYSDISLSGTRTAILAQDLSDDYNDNEVFYANLSETIQLTDNFTEEFSPLVLPDEVVWSGTVGGRTTEIFTYDGENISSTDAGEDFLYRDLQGDGESILYVEENLPNRSFRVVFVNSNDESVELPITGDPQMDFDFIDIGSDKAVWSQSIEGEDGITNSEIFLYNGTETVRLTNDVGDNVEPKVAGDFVVWTRLGNDSDVFLYDGETTTQITDNDINDEGVVVSDTGVVAWTNQEGVFAYQNGNTTKIFNREAADDSIQLDAGNNDIFIRSDLGLYSYDGENLNNIVNQSPANFDVSGENIAWNDSGDAAYLAIPYAPNTVFRFLNSDTGVHFYTPNVEEANNVRDNLENYTFEGGSYVGIDPLTGQPEPSSVYRFLNRDTGVHLYTISEAERSAVQELDNYSFEGESFLAYETEVDGSIPVYRFLNYTTGAHFYTSSVAERDNLEANLPDYQSEGIAYYVLPSEI